MRTTGPMSAYELNPDCGCEVCATGGVPARDPNAGHSYAYGEPHMPPRSVRPLIGAGTFIHPTAYVADGVTIGRGCRIGPGASIGWHGFGYSPDPAGGWQRKPETHSVVIGDNVDIGANTCIDRGSYRDTTIGAGTKIDNLCHIAHNVEIGQSCLVIAGAEVSGSVVIGAGAWVGPNACIKEHLTIGARAMVGIGAVVLGDIPADQTWVGNPARVLNAEVGVRADG
jgi:UDP-3-O-[3-hydroxymyristoyl] glucosamine N-acyltransferase